MARSKVHATEGFTLVELMVVVSVLGILSAIAVLSYQRYTLRARISEAYGMLGMIRMRQESYRSEFSQYCDVSSATHDGTSGASAGYYPTSAPSRDPVDWGNSPPPEWVQLGVRPTGPVYFRYDTVAGNPGVNPVAPNGGGDLGYSMLPNQDAWWMAHAYGDLDGDGTQSLFEATSFTRGVWVSNETE